MPRTFQGRLTFGFVGVVALTLLLVSVLVLNRLDNYFYEQQRADLDERAQTVAEYLVAVADAATGTIRPVVSTADVVNPAVVAQLQVQRTVIADRLAQADVAITFGLLTDDGFVPASNGSLPIQHTAQPRGDQKPDSISASRFLAVENTLIPYGIRVELSNPYTYRAKLIATVTALLAAVGLFALGLSIIVAAALARRFTTPLRRLTEASRELAEGNLASRVPADHTRAAPAEMTELADQFNTMAERLEESVEIIRRDRDRSRDFLADVSHELRTPIAALRTFNDLLRERAGGDPAARTEFLESSGQQIERLDWLAQNLLELSKLDSGLVLLDLRPDDLRAAVESAVDQARATARRRRVELTLALPDSPVRIRHDPQRIGQVVTNLVGNAIKFTPAGGRVEVAVRPYLGGGRIEVSDNGVGIDAAELPRIFDRFYRGSRANEARGSGSGLGLAIVRSIVDMHNGSIAVESGLGTGSRFTVSLPRDPRTGEPPADGGARAEAAGSDELANVADSSSREGARLNPGTSS
jgi:signal transduction histidine kinase